MISLMAVFLISSVIALYGKKINYIISEKPKMKTIQFSIFAGGDYSSSLYKRSKARVVLSVYRYKGDQREMVWTGNIDERNIKSYPLNSNPLFRKVCIYDVYESKETLVASYQVLYDSKGSKMSYEDGIILSKGESNDSVSISI